MLRTWALWFGDGFLCGHTFRGVTEGMVAISTMRSDPGQDGFEVEVEKLIPVPVVGSEEVLTEGMDMCKVRVPVHSISHHVQHM